MKQYEQQLELEFGKILKAREEEIRNQITAELAHNIEFIRRREKEEYERKLEDMKEKFEALVQVRNLGGDPYYNGLLNKNQFAQKFYHDPIFLV